MRDAQAGEGKVEIVKVQDLIEQDFGFYEGKPFMARSDAKKSGREAHHDRHKDDPGFVDGESKESMCNRADAFLDQHLIPLVLSQSRGEAEMAIAVVSHGMLLGNLWRRLLLRLPRRSLKVAAEVTAERGPVVLEHLGGWSNTGYLELELEHSRGETKDVPAAAAVSSAEGVLNPASEEESPGPAMSSLAPPANAAGEASSSTLPTPVPPPVAAEDTTPSVEPEASSLPSSVLSPPNKGMTLAGWSTTILAVDNKQHLIGFKRQRGGIGRIAHDEGQKKLDGFFKRQKKG